MGPISPASSLARDDIDARMAQEQQIGRFHEDSGQILLQAIDLPRLGLPVFVERLPDPRQVFAERIGRGGVAGPRHEAFHGPRLRPKLVFAQASAAPRKRPRRG